MPWKASSVMEERLRFIARLLDSEPMTDLCHEFGISRKTGYKICQNLLTTVYSVTTMAVFLKLTPP